MYFYNGFYTCADTNSCLYQKTPEHEEIIKIMVKKYKNNDENFHNSCSLYYEDTEYGRIFSSSYEHLNRDNISYDRLVNT